jgi:hypothetical protein
MKKILQVILIALALLAPVSGLAGVGAVASADSLAGPVGEVCQGVNGSAATTCADGGVDLSKILKIVLDILSIVAGVLAVVMVIVSGMKYITSSGEAQAISSAKKTLTYAIVGIVIVAVAQTLVRFVLVNVK